MTEPDVRHRLTLILRYRTPAMMKSLNRSVLITEIGWSGWGQSRPTACRLDPPSTQALLAALSTARSA